MNTEDLATVVYILFGVTFLLILILIIATIYLYWKVHNLSKDSGKDGQKTKGPKDSKDLGLQLVNQRFQIPKPNLKKGWEGNNDLRNNFGAENKSFKNDQDEHRSNNISLQGSAFRNQFSGHNDLDAVSDSNFSLSIPNHNLRDDPRSRRGQDDQRSKGNDSGISFPGQNDFDPAHNHFSFNSQNGPQKEFRNKRDQEDRMPFGVNLRSTNSFRNPLSAQNDFDSMNDNFPHSQQRNIQRNINY